MAFGRLRSPKAQAGGQGAGGEGPRRGFPFPPAVGTNQGGEGPNLLGGDGGGRERPRGGGRGQSPTQGLTTRARRAIDRTLTRAGGGRPRGPHSPRSGGTSFSTETLRPGGEGALSRAAGTVQAASTPGFLRKVPSAQAVSAPGRRAGGRAPQPQEAALGRRRGAVSRSSRRARPGRVPFACPGPGPPQGRQRGTKGDPASQEPPIFISILQMKGFFVLFSRRI